MDRWKAEMGRVREKRRVEERRSEKRQSQKKEDADARKGRKVAKHCVFPMICGSAGSKSRLAKAAGAEPSGQMRDEKLHAVVARSTFWSQNVQSTPFSDHFWKLRDVEKVHAVVARSTFVTETPHVRTTFGSWDVEKVHAVVARSTFPSQNVKNTRVLSLKLEGGSLAELLRFWFRQLWKMKTSRKIASFLTLSSSNIEEISQNCSVFDVVKFETWGRLAE